MNDGNLFLFQDFQNGTKVFLMEDTGMKPQVYRIRLVCLLLYQRDLLLNEFGLADPGAQNSQAAGFGYRGSQRGCADPLHGALNDGFFYTKQRA